MPAQALRRISWAGQVWHRRRPGRAVLSRLGAATVLAAVATLSVPAAPALAQSSGDMTALMERIERLQRDVNLLQRQVYRGEAPPPIRLWLGKRLQAVPPGLPPHLMIASTGWRKRLASLPAGSKRLTIRSVR